MSPADWFVVQFYVVAELLMLTVTVFLWLWIIEQIEKRL